MATRHWVGGLEMPQGPSPCLAFHEVLGQGWHIPLFFRYISVSFVRFWGFWRSLFITFARTFGTQLCRCKRYPETIPCPSSQLRTECRPATLCIALTLFLCNACTEIWPAGHGAILTLLARLHLLSAASECGEKSWPKLVRTSETFFQEQRNLTDDFKPEGTRALIHPSNHLVL